MARRFFKNYGDNKFPYMMLSRLIMDCKYYKEHPEELYVSDGDALTFVINKADENLVTVDTSYEKYVK